MSNWRFISSLMLLVSTLMGLGGCMIESPELILWRYDPGNEIREAHILNIGRRNVLTIDRPKQDEIVIEIEGRDLSIRGGIDFAISVDGTVRAQKGVPKSATGFSVSTDSGDSSVSEEDVDFTYQPHPANENILLVVLKKRYTDLLDTGDEVIVSIVGKVSSIKDEEEYRKLRILYDKAIEFRDKAIDKLKKEQGQTAEASRKYEEAQRLYKKAKAASETVNAEVEEFAMQLSKLSGSAKSELEKRNAKRVQLSKEIVETKRKLAALESELDQARTQSTKFNEDVESASKMVGEAMKVLAELSANDSDDSKERKTQIATKRALAEQAIKLNEAAVAENLASLGRVNSDIIRLVEQTNTRRNDVKTLNEKMATLNEQKSEEESKFERLGKLKAVASAEMGGLKDAYEKQQRAKDTASAQKEFEEKKRGLEPLFGGGNTGAIMSSIES